MIAEHRLRYLQHLLDRVIVRRRGDRREWTAEQFGGAGRGTRPEGLRGDVRRVELPGAGVRDRRRGRRPGA
ncbi:MAG: hypothetical protein R2719_01320 [Micropruina sp.]